MPGGLGTPELVADVSSEGSLVGWGACPLLVTSGPACVVGVRSHCSAHVKDDSSMGEGLAWEVLHGPGTCRRGLGAEVSNPTHGKGCAAPQVHILTAFSENGYLWSEGRLGLRVNKCEKKRKNQNNPDCGP